MISKVLNAVSNDLLHKTKQSCTDLSRAEIYLLEISKIMSIWIFEPKGSSITTVQWQYWLLYSCTSEPLRRAICSARRLSQGRFDAELNTSRLTLWCSMDGFGNKDSSRAALSQSMTSLFSKQENALEHGSYWCCTSSPSSALPQSVRRSMYFSSCRTNLNEATVSFTTASDMSNKLMHASLFTKNKVWQIILNAVRRLWNVKILS